MNRRWLQFIACSLALCFALAGPVAIHPSLHRWVEHGGAGHDHHHLGAVHAHPHPHPHTPSEKFVLRPSSFRPPTDGLTLFGLQPQDIYRAVAGWLARAAQNDPAPDDESEHTHHSLPQLLASGLAEGAVEILPFALRPEARVWFSSRPESRIAARALYAPTAGRGPPVFC